MSQPRELPFQFVLGSKILAVGVVNIGQTPLLIAEKKEMLWTGDVADLQLLDL